MHYMNFNKKKIIYAIYNVTSGISVAFHQFKCCEIPDLADFQLASCLKLRNL